MKNTGKLPAFFVNTDARLVPLFQNPLATLQKLTAERRQGPTLFGYPFFSNDKLNWFTVLKYPRDKITKYFDDQTKIIENLEDIHHQKIKITQKDIDNANSFFHYP